MGLTMSWNTSKCHPNRHRRFIILLILRVTMFFIEKSRISFLLCLSDLVWVLRILDNKPESNRRFCLAFHFFHCTCMLLITVSHVQPCNTNLEKQPFLSLLIFNLFEIYAELGKHNKHHMFTFLLKTIFMFRL